MSESSGISPPKVADMDAYRAHIRNNNTAYSEHPSFGRKGNIMAETTVTTASGVSIPESDREAIEKAANRRMLTKVAVVGGIFAAGFIFRGRVEARGIRLTANAPITS